MTRSTALARLSFIRPSFNCSSCTGHLLTRSFIRTNYWNRTSKSAGVTRQRIKNNKIAEEEWEARAEEIRSGTRISLLSLLEQRGYVSAIAGSREDLEQLTIEKRFGAYVGVDSTAPSLHVGHLLPFMALFWLHVHGVHTVSIIGDGTAKVGDPTGRTTARQPLDKAERKLNSISMHFQLRSLWHNMETHVRKHGYTPTRAWKRGQLSNTVWLSTVTLMEFLQLLGNGMKIGAMLGRDTVRSKFQKGIGISFSEFAYPLLQAWDWWHLHQSKGITVQIGGADQFGNIMAGIDAVKHILKSHPDPDIRDTEEKLHMKPMGFTVPLLTTASGEKFGKSAGNAVWLDKNTTSVFDQYQFFFRSADADVGRYLRLFTFIPLSDIDQLMSEHEKVPSKRTAQRRLAQEVIALVHGQEEADAVESQHFQLFPSSNVKVDLKSIDQPNDQSSFRSIKRPAIHVVLPKSLVCDQPMGRILYAAGLARSRSAGHRLAITGGAYIGGQPGVGGGMGDEVKFTPVTNWHSGYTAYFVMEGDILLLRTGKWKVRVIKIISDEEFEEKRLDCPGWKEWKESHEVVDEAEDAEVDKWQDNPNVKRRQRKIGKSLAKGSDGEEAFAEPSKNGNFRTKHLKNLNEESL